MVYSKPHNIYYRIPSRKKKKKAQNDCPVTRVVRMLPGVFSREGLNNAITLWDMYVYIQGGKVLGSAYGPTEIIY